MKKNIHTNVYFDYGGYYSDEHDWISRNPMYGISFKTSSLEEITYSVLVDKICRKIAIDETSGKPKLSYSLSKSRRELSIVDDEDVYVFITSLDSEGLKPVLHVELFNDLENNQRVKQLSRAGQGSSFGANYGELGSNGRVNDVENAGIFTILREGEKTEQQNELIIEEPMENVVNENVVNEDCENVSCNEIAAVDSSMDNHVDDGLDGRHEYVKLPCPVEESQYVKEWEDGTGLEINQEFCSKEAVQDFVHIAANKNRFGVQTVKSDKERLMLRCRQASQGCKWYLLAARIKKSDLFSVRVHKKMHTCSRSIETTSNSKQTCTSRLVASVLHEDYPGQLETPSPKNIVSIIQERLGLYCSYSTAWRGKKQHTSNVLKQNKDNHL